MATKRTLPKRAPANASSMCESIPFCSLQAGSMIHTNHHRCTHIPAHSDQPLCAPGEMAISRWRPAAMGWPSRAEQMSRTCIRSCSSLTSPSAGSQTGGNPSCLPPRPLSSSGGPPCLLPCLPLFPAPLHHLFLSPHKTCQRSFER